MNAKIIAIFLFGIIITGSSCASKKQIEDLNYEVENITNELRATEFELSECNKQLSSVQTSLKSERTENELLRKSKDEMIADLRNQIADLKKQREQQYTQVDELTVLSKAASENMGQTIKQLEQKDRYIRNLQDAKSKTDSLNLALAINLKSVLKKGIEDQDIEVKVDKTVVFINISDKMLFQSGSYKLTNRASEVLSKIAEIAKSRPELDIMVEGYTDNVPINTACIEDNWDLSVKRSSTVVKTLQTKYGLNPDKLIAAGRGEYNKLSDNSTAEGRAMNRRTRIILMPRLNQFYDLLKPEVLTLNQ